MCNIIGLTNYKPPKKEYLQFKSVKDRKNFIKDMATVRIAISLLDVSLQGDSFNGEIKTFHLNKDRKVEDILNMAYDSINRKVLVK